MQEQPILSEREWTLVLQLLQTERDELPAEIHHTDSREYAGELEDREKIIDGLVQRLRACGLNA